MCLNPFLLFLFLQGFSWDNFNFQQFLPLLISNLVVVGVFLFFSVNNTKTIKHHEQHIALTDNTTGSGNTAIGSFALENNTSGENNAALGAGALFENTVGNQNAAVGRNALRLATGSNNTAIGYESGRDVTDADKNTFVGNNTGRGITTGNGNTVIGANVTGLSATLTNTIIIADGDGNQRIYVNKGGDVGINNQNPTATLHVTNSGDNDNAQVIIPNLELFNGGNFAYYNSTQNYGPASNLFNDAADTGGDSFHAYRTNAGQDWGIGYSFDNDYTITQVRFQARGNGGWFGRTGGGQIQIWKDGAMVAASTTIAAAAGNGQWTTAYTPNVVGDEVRYIFLGGVDTQRNDGIFNASEFEIIGQVPEADKITLKIEGRSELDGLVQLSSLGAGTLETHADGNVSVSSDERLKNIRGEFTKGLDALLNIQPIQYRWNTTSGLDPQGLYTGFSAQNVQQHLPEAVGQDTRGYLTLSDRPLLAAMTNALKELHAQNEVLTQQNDSLKAALEALEKRLEALEKN